MTTRTKKQRTLRRARLTAKQAQTCCAEAQKAFSKAKAATRRAEERLTAALEALELAREAAWNASAVNTASWWEFGELPYHLGEVQQNLSATHSAVWHASEMFEAEPDEGISDSDIEVVRDAVRVAEEAC